MKTRSPQEIHKYCAKCLTVIEVLKTKGKTMSQTNPFAEYDVSVPTTNPLTDSHRVMYINAKHESVCCYGTRASTKIFIALFFVPINITWKKTQELLNKNKELLSGILYAWVNRKPQMVNLLTQYLQNRFDKHIAPRKSR